MCITFPWNERLGDCLLQKGPFDPEMMSRRLKIFLKPADSTDKALNGSGPRVSLPVEAEVKRDRVNVTSMAGTRSPS